MHMAPDKSQGTGMTPPILEGKVSHCHTCAPDTCVPLPGCPQLLPPAVPGSGSLEMEGP